MRQLGVLGTSAAAEDVALSVGAALRGVPRRIAYRSALFEHDLVVHPARSIQVATDRRVRTRTLSGRPLRTVIEPPEALDVGRVRWGASWLSDRDRAVLDAAQRPRLVDGLEVLVEAFAAATPALHTDVLTEYARRLGWAAALRRLGSLADALALEPVAGRLTPIKPITADLDLEPGTDEPTVWRDRRWRVRWPRTADELLAVIGQITNRAQTTRQAARDGVPAPTVERDCVLANIIATLGALDDSHGLAFKGGTALSFC